MIKVNSLSGGKTSSYIAANYPADYDVFALVRVEDENCRFPDEKIRKEVEDRIQAPFIGTVEDDTIIYTMLDLEQYIGRPITWLTGKTFDDILVKPSGKMYLPSYSKRFCTTEMKVLPIKKFWFDNIREPVEMRIGFRANEHSRAKSMLNRLNENGFESEKFVVSKTKSGRNRWADLEWRKPVFPLIEGGVFKDTIEKYWKDKPVRFAWMNNCVGCMHKHPILLNKMSKKHPEKLEWFANKERLSGKTWREHITYDKIISYNFQEELFDDDFNECDSGFCGL